VGTPHIAAESGDFAPDVLMPGDPRRARRIADLVLDDARQVTDVRGILGFTGTHEGRPLSVLASGMGMPSMTIYATELFRFYGVRRIVRVGTCGGMSPDVDVNDVVVALAAHTDSGMTASRIPGVHFSHVASFDLVRRAAAHVVAGARTHVGTVLTSDHFYLERPELFRLLTEHGTLAVEMEAAALYAAAAAAGAEALAVLTVSDHLLTAVELTADEREQAFHSALEVALAALAE
jgi:purine-nucleoside phosphorylase